MMKKHEQIHFHSKTPHTITKMNDNINLDSTNKGNNKITEHRAIFQRESQNS